MELTEAFLLNALALLTQEDKNCYHWQPQAWGLLSGSVNWNAILLSLPEWIKLLANYFAILVTTGELNGYDNV